jgi:hypothetical protein
MPAPIIQDLDDYVQLKTGGYTTRSIARIALVSASRAALRGGNVSTSTRAISPNHFGVQLMLREARDNGQRDTDIKQFAFGASVPIKPLTDGPAAALSSASFASAASRSWTLVFLAGSASAASFRSSVRVLRGGHWCLLSRLACGGVTAIGTGSPKLRTLSR